MTAQLASERRVIKQGVAEEDAILVHFVESFGSGTQPSRASRYRRAEYLPSFRTYKVRSYGAQITFTLRMSRMRRSANYAP